MRQQAGLALAFALTLASCGGGGDDSPAIPPGTFDVERAVSTLLTTPLSFSALRGTDRNGQTFVMDFQMRPSAPVVFEGVTYADTVMTTSIRPADASATTDANRGRVYTPWGEGREVVETHVLSLAAPSRMAGAIGVLAPTSSDAQTRYQHMIHQTKQPLPSPAGPGNLLDYWTDVYTPHTQFSTRQGAFHLGSAGGSISLQGHADGTGTICLWWMLQQCFRINAAGDILGVEVTRSFWTGGGNVYTAVAPQGSHEGVVFR